MPNPHVLIAGAGLGGLLSADLLLDRGLDVTLLERSAPLGGLAQTDEQAGFSLHRGPRALYRGGALRRLLLAQGIEVRGHVPPNRGVCASRGGDIVPLLGATKGGRWRLLPALTTLWRTSPAAVAHRGVSGWLAEQTRGNAEALAFLQAAVRIATYCAADDLSAEVALGQLQGAARGVLYLDGGWSRLVEQLARKVRARGARIVTEAAVHKLEHGPDGVRLETARGAYEGDAVVLACARPAAQTLLDGALAPAEPAQVSCLDLALRGTCRGPTLVLGIDAPTYLSVHSRVAALAPAGDEVVHVVGYDGAPRAALERVLDGWDPAWRDRVVHVRYLPRMNVTGHLPTGAEGGLAARASSDFAPRVQLVGDWVGPEGYLADGTAHSAEAACHCIAARLHRAPLAGAA